MNVAAAARWWWHAPRRVCIVAVRGYQVWLSPLTPPSCRHSPTCSQYSVEAFGERGAVQGLLLTVWRVARCNPWQSGGWDPVPPRKHRRSE